MPGGKFGRPQSWAGVQTPPSAVLTGVAFPVGLNCRIATVDLDFREPKRHQDSSRDADDRVDSAVHIGLPHHFDYIAAHPTEENSQGQYTQLPALLPTPHPALARRWQPLNATGVRDAVCFPTVCGPGV